MTRNSKMGREDSMKASIEQESSPSLSNNKKMHSSPITKRPMSSIKRPEGIQPALKVQIGKKGEKIPLTGDDLMIEYCERLMIALK